MDDAVGEAMGENSEDEENSPNEAAEDNYEVEDEEANGTTGFIAVNGLVKQITCQHFV